MYGFDVIIGNLRNYREIKEVKEVKGIKELNEFIVSDNVVTAQRILLPSLPFSSRQRASYPLAGFACALPFSAFRRELLLTIHAQANPPRASHREMTERAGKEQGV